MSFPRRLYETRLFFLTISLMRAAHRLFLFRVFSLVALGTSVALLIDYASPEPTFCATGSGCGAVRRSGLGYLPIPGLGFVPLPLFGVLAFGLLFSLSLLENPIWRRKACLPLALALGPAGLVLLGLQAWLGAFCAFCVVVDLSALALFACAISLRGDGWDRAAYEETSQLALVDPARFFSESLSVRGVWTEDSRIYTPPTPLVRPAPADPFRLHKSAWVILGTLAVLGPWLYPRFAQRGEAPPAIVALQEPGKINVVEFFDFECPHCRSLGPRLRELLEPYGDRVHFVPRHVPLRGHPHAREAARVALCAGEQGREEDVSQAILAAEDLSKPALLELTARVGLDRARLEGCLASQRPDARLEEDLVRLEAAGFEGLPTTYVGDVRIVGALPDDVYVDALEKVAQGKDKSGLAPGFYWSLVGLVVVLTFAWGRKRPPDTRVP